MKEILFPVLMSVSALGAGCSDQGFRAMKEDTATGAEEVTPLPSASASGETFLEACGPVSSAFAPLDKTNDSEPEAKSLAAIDAYNSVFAEAVATELEKLPVTEFVDAKVPITIGFFLNGGDYGGDVGGDPTYVTMNVAIGDLSGAWQNWLNAGDSSVRDFFHGYDGIETFIECRMWASTLTPTNYDWDTDLFGDRLIYSDNLIYQQELDSDSSEDIIADVYIRYINRAVESVNSASIGDQHYVTDFSGALFIDHGIEEDDVSCDDGTCYPPEDFVDVGDLVIAPTQRLIADTMKTMINLAVANVPEGERQALVVTQVGVDNL